MWTVVGRQGTGQRKESYGKERGGRTTFTVYRSVFASISSSQHNFENHLLFGLGKKILHAWTIQYSWYIWKRTFFSAFSFIRSVIQINDVPRSIGSPNSCLFFPWFHVLLVLIQSWLQEIKLIPSKALTMWWRSCWTRRTGYHWRSKDLRYWGCCNSNCYSDSSNCCTSRLVGCYDRRGSTNCSGLCRGCCGG